MIQMDDECELNENRIMFYSTSEFEWNVKQIFLFENAGCILDLSFSFNKNKIHFSPFCFWMPTQ